MGDDGTINDSTDALNHLLSLEYSNKPTQRSFWGTICFQANEQLDGGAVWAWEQYALPPIGSISKAQLYQGLHSSAAILSLITAMIRVYQRVQYGKDLVEVNVNDKKTYIKATPLRPWGEYCFSQGKSFLGGKLHDRPLLQSKSRKPDWNIHDAYDVLRIISAGDSQPGGQIPALTQDSKTSLFAYGAIIHEKISSIPKDLYVDKWGKWNDIPNGTIIAVRQGAIFIKTKPVSFVPSQTNSTRDVKKGIAAGIWITLGRLPKKNIKEPLEPKIPMVEAVKRAGHGRSVEGVKEWEQVEGDWDYKEGEWKAVYVKRVESGDGIAQLVYWNF